MDTIEKTRIADDRLAANRETVRAFIDALFTKGDLTAVDTYLAEDFLNHDPPVGSDTTREGMRAAAALFRGAFPDWHAAPDFMVAEDDLVVEHFSASGTQRGEIFGAPATGRTVTLRGINIFRLRDGRIVERWGRLDELGLLRQLGLAQGPG
ncbi:ester cyclase [Kitasatospora sp. NPDC048540]|uniref:ester cyclase n=1 Tax=unclassified Kitasatospora TaxID=2633591 RepID=UPI00053B1BC9|nr:ester cyclase [Kitasatospora sp. MBT63]